MKKRKVLILLLITYFPTLLFAQLDSPYFNKLKTERVVSEDDISWKQFGPGNAGFADFIRYHPTKPDVVVTVPDLFVVYQSEDNGKQWYNIKDKDGNGEFQRLYDLYYSANNEDFGIAIESSQVWKTEDMGRNWSIVNNCPWYVVDTDGSDREGWRSKVSALALDPTDDNIWYVGAGFHPRGQERFSSSKDANRANPRGIASFTQGKMWKTTNAGASWTEISTGLNPKDQFSRIVVNPTNNQQIFAASLYGLKRSNDGGTTWSDIGNGKLPNNTIMDMDYYYNPTTGKFILYFIDQVRYEPSGNTTTNSGGIFKTEDGGNTFTNINGDLYIDVNQLTGGVPINYYKYIAKWFGITLAQAQSTYPVIPTNVLQYFNSLNVDPSREDALYIGFADAQVQNSIMPGRLWVTSNGGSHWVNTAREFAPAWEKDKAYWQSRNNPVNDNMEFGHEKFDLQFNQDYPLRSLRYCHVNSRGDVMIIASHNTLLSTDNGASWKQVDEDYTPAGNLMGRGNSNLPGEAMLQDKRLGPDRPLLGSGEHRFWRVRDDGTNGRQAVVQTPTAAETISAIAVHPFNEDIIYTTSFRQRERRYIMRSTDGGDTFSEWSMATPADREMRTHALTIDSQNPKIMYFGISDKNGADANKIGGFYFSEDEGKTFTPRNNGLPTNARVFDIEVDPRDNSGKSLFAACQVFKFSFSGSPIVDNGGLYHTNDYGLNWTKIDIAPVVTGINRIKFDNTNRMYVTSGHRNNPLNNGGIWYTDNFGTNWTRVFDSARTEAIDVSPFDNNVLIATIGQLQRNPGIYLSEDRGLTWKKNNIDGLNTLIREVQFDLFDPTKLWSVSMGNGFNIGSYPNGATSKALNLTPFKSKIAVNEILEITPEILNTTFTASDIVWKSSNEAIATVDQNGNVTGISGGKVEIMALINDRFSDVAVVVVDPSLPVANLDPSSLSIDNFGVQSIGITCPDQDNGSVIVTSKIAANFKLNISGNAINTDYDFQEILDTKNLKNGTYKIIITIDGNTDYKQEFDVIVANVDALNVSSKISDSKKTLTLNLEGSSNYTIELNDEEIQTSANEITLALTDGTNNLKVSTDKDCQGVYKKTFFIDNSFLLYPNPVIDELTVAVSENLINSTAYVYDMAGRLVKVQPILHSESKILMDNSQKGMFFIVFKKNEENMGHSKFIVNKK